MKNKKLFIILGVVTGVIVVMAAAFIGGRMLNRSGNPSGGNIVSVGGGSGAVLSEGMKFNPAPELPTTQLEVVGTYVKRQDNSIFLQEFSMDSSGSGGVSVSSSVVGSSSSSNSPSNNGPQVEVVITKKTKIYTDITQYGSNKDTTIQQVVKQGTLDDISPQGLITVWGRKDGDRVIADVILYSTPVTMIDQP